MAAGAIAALDFILSLIGKARSDDQIKEDHEYQRMLVEEANKANYANVTATNLTNRLNVQETNSTNKALADLAYQRSLPVNQVRDLMTAGMSKSAALNKLAGGGVYSPPTLQSSTDVAPNEDYARIPISPRSDYSGILQGLLNIPATVEQSELRQQALSDAKQKSKIELDRAQREAELHEYDIWQKKYGKETATILDTVSSDIAKRLLDSGKTADDFKSFDSMIHAIGADKTPEYQKLPHIARTQLESGFADKFAALRAERDQANKDIQAKDAHELSKIANGLQGIELKWSNKYHQAQYLKLMRESEKLLADGRLVDANTRHQLLEFMVRKCGIDSEMDARAIEQQVRYLESLDEYDLQNRRIVSNQNTLGVWNQFRVLLRDLGDILHGIKFPAK